MFGKVQREVGTCPVFREGDGERQEIIVALDWTDYDADDHSMIVLSMITSHGNHPAKSVWRP
ncbi:hypothetical protein [Anaeromyxobacter oryzisoli]|uniref:hypothetical protein n=1 Tax=Anaeromyxobacter oryzisoli TaxID=2925408 RepID=UPI001F584179|nr:hypothetical protein [Anaeromyxobacter sp. SG63]